MKNTEVYSGLVVLGNPLCRLRVTDTLFIDSYKPMPCAWFRFWAWVLLGWKWEAVQ
jgi:hypothetical protein